MVFWIKLYNRLFANQFDNRYYDTRLQDYSKRESPSSQAIGDHICTLFYEVVSKAPQLVVELGTRGGESTRAILAAASYADARVLSIDVDPCGEVGLEPEKLAKWEFIQSDDLAFGKKRFTEWCAGHGLEPKIDLLFLDTSHEYEHTRQELDVWLPFVPPGATVIFHDTNMAAVYRKQSNRLAVGWQNERGVIRALEGYFGARYDENLSFVDVRRGWLVRHYPWSSGLTVLQRLQG